MPGLEDLTTDQLLATARSYEGSHNLLQTLMNDPETREQVQRGIKKVNPKAVIPEIDAKDAMANVLREEREKREALEQDILKERLERKLAEQRASIKTKYRLNDADVLEVEKLMTAEHDPIPSYDAAARVFVASRQPAQPTPSAIHSPTFSMPEKDVWGKGIGNKAALDRIALDEAYAAFNDIRSGKVAGLGPAVSG